jgi:hypothetical protein
MTWNSEGILCSGRELALLNLLTDNYVDISIITEAEIPSSSHGNYNVKGFSYLPHPSNLLKADKYSVVTLVRSAYATSTKILLYLMHALVQSVWIQLDISQGTCQGTWGLPVTRVLIGGLYREWSNLVLETTALSKVREQLQSASAEADKVVLAGDVNLNTARSLNVRFRRRCLMLAFLQLCKRGPDPNSHQKAQDHLRWDPNGHPQDGVQCLVQAHLSPGEHVAVVRHLQGGLLDRA